MNPSKWNVGSPPHEECAALIKRLKNDDQKAIEIIYNLYYRSIMLSAQKYVSEQDSHDVVNITFTTLWKGRKKIKNWEHLLGFLFLTVRNTCLVWLRTEKNENKKRKGYETRLQHDQDESFDYVFDRLSSICLEDVQALIDTELSGNTKKAMQLFIQGYEIDEVAKVLNISRETAQNYKSLGISKLRQYLNN